MPDFLYHAAPRAVADLIAGSGLQSRSTGGSETEPYLCMTGTESGATTLNPRASDVIFRASFAALDAAEWRQKGAGLNEWRKFSKHPEQFVAIPAKSRNTGSKNYGDRSSIIQRDCSKLLPDIP